MIYGYSLICLIKCFCAVFQSFNDIYALGTGTLALSAFYTVGCAAFVLDSVVVVPFSAVYLFPDKLSVSCTEYFGNGNIHRTALCAVMTGGAGDGVDLFERLLCLFYNFKFGIGHGYKVLHIRSIILHLFNI